MAHEIIQEVKTPSDEKLKFVSVAFDEDNCLYQTKVYENDELLGTIKGDDILYFVATLFKGYAVKKAVRFHTAKEVMKEYSMTNKDFFYKLKSKQ